MPRSVRRTLRRVIYTALISALASSTVSAQDANELDCSSALTVDGNSYNLATLSGTKTVKRTRKTPPSTMEDELRFDVCKDLPRRDDTADTEQCPTGTRACLTKTNQKSGEKDRIISVIPVAQSATLNPEYSLVKEPAGLSIILHGGSYPSDASSSLSQSLNLTLLCTQDGSLEPTLMSYENGVVNVQWNTTVGCSGKQNDGGNEGNGNNGNTGGGGKEVEEGSGSSGSGIGWFFLLLFISFLGYFALGAYYNYNNFGATGWDLVPHRDFWRDVPYLFRDFTEHLCSTLRPGRSGASRRGYMAV